MFTKKNTIIISLIIFSTPIILGLLLNIPTGFLTIGDENSWVGFFGNYSGGIIGGIVAFLIARIQIEESNKGQINEKVEREKYTSIIVEEFLYDEMRNILSGINNHLTSALHARYNNGSKVDYYYSMKNLETPIFEQIKFDLIKFDNQIVKETIKFYRAVNILKKAETTSKMSEDTAQFVFEQIILWRERLDT